MRKPVGPTPRDSSADDAAVSRALLPSTDDALGSTVSLPATAHQEGQSVWVLSDEDLQSPRRRRVVLPIALLAITCVSTFWAGATHWQPLLDFAWMNPQAGVHGLLAEMWRSLARGWAEGLTYTCCVLAILLTHEMGHFLATHRCGVPASLPYFIPFPLSPLGTMGAVIGMEGHRANRRQMFDIGIAGPLAGLVVAVPVLWIGVQRLDLGGGPGARWRWTARGWSAS